MSRRAIRRAGTGVTWPGFLAGAGLALLLAFLLAPTLVIVPMSLGRADYLEFPPRGLTLRWYAAYFGDADWLAATWFSLRVATASAVLAVVVGTLGALGLVRGSMPGAAFIRAAALGPLVVPHIVLAVGLYLIFAPAGLTGTFGGFVLAHAMLALPYVVMTVTSALERSDPALELAALNCGASRVRAFVTVVLPDIATGVGSGAVFAFIASFDEATVSFFISGLHGKPLARKFFEDIDANLTPTIAAVSTLMTGATILLMLGLGAASDRRVARPGLP